MHTTDLTHEARFVASLQDFQHIEQNMQRFDGICGFFSDLF